MNKPLLITGYEPRKSKYGKDYALVTAIDEEGREVEFYVNWYMLEQLKEVELPMTAVVKRRDKGPYFMFITVF